MDPFASNTSTHEAFIRAMLEAESCHHTFFGSMWGMGPLDSHARLPRDGQNHWKDGGHATYDSHATCCAGVVRRGGNKQCVIKITTLTPFLCFGKWYFGDVDEAEMRS